ncbi:dienelactone hydrolase family protein [Achromobacter ruhlandii]|uniref:Dienelactone hydrolase domain-containing protein n=1 Tax=Achromobacter ruhlandii TaxID=72557 RepID=A0ABM8LYF2_9BURK|nr:dienelactone hydrolase family protein [Achromobacter ruhlandii]AKP88098.1 Dienelactone hydrolase family [Achromobacter xylosoxidans]AOU91288.1 dienelactone hydrolase family protein [Achromobacter ruhlandii]MCZ8433158.1 dienelactone hydrolase family protein [Achromobacter ruhlandii]MDC6091572.1 dienelactone hydrolase family protein [Achromobacter ruhlandii]MDC6154115.1 dienelactone hydrolase family protein [Achromobacter ruhlandii]
MTATITTREVTIASHDGQSFSAYLAVPAAGHGPGLVLCQEIFGINDFMRRTAQALADEGYVVLAPDLFWRQQPGIQLTDGPADMPRAFELYQRFDVELGVKDIASTLTALRALPEQQGGAGVLGYCLGGKLAYLAACRTDADVAIGYYGVGIEDSLEEAANLRGRLVLHIAEQDGFCPPPARQRILEALGGKANVELYVYPGMDHAFARTGGAHYDKPSALMAHQRSMAALQRVIGPQFDYSALWDKHCEYEFGTRDVAATMATMVAEPYVNHIPTMTGGVGYRELSRFYQHHFVNSNPPDTRLVPLSRTVGATQIVDELLFCFTHTTEIDWLLPGVAPTGKYVEIPLVAIVKFRGDKLCHEHIYWDQASVLVQIGVLDPKGLPVAGRETAQKLLDETLPSNTLMARWKDSENK